LNAQQRHAIEEKIPVRRFCEPEEVTHTVRFPVHPLAGVITGDLIDQNGVPQLD
jgi:3-oxoacyl-[acyl-carrier protein] reductase